MNSSGEYQRFISWQCRLRKMSMRELGGRPTPGMSAGVHGVSTGDEKARMNFLILKREPELLTSDFRHIVRKTRDPGEWMKNGLRILSEWLYQNDQDFSAQLTALFSLDSALAEALLEAGKCHLVFVQDSIEHAFDFKVEALSDENPAFQATYWHNHLFNASMPGKVQVLGFNPQIKAC
jgi:hypothetical protein